MGKRIKVRVSLVIELDADEWLDTFGVSGPEARADIKSYALGCVQQSAGIEECSGTVRLA